jgi:hypothetical protein
MDAIVAEKPEPVEAAAPAVPAEPTEITIKLRKAVQAHGELVKTLTFRAPTGGDIMALGDTYPININWVTGQIKVNPLPMGQIMSALAMVPPSTIKMLSARDWSTCAHALMGFFPPDEQAM